MATRARLSVGLLALLAVAACHGARNEPRSQEAASGLEAGPNAPSDAGAGAARDPADVRPWFADPSLAAVADLDRQGDHAGAARALETLRAAQGGSAERVCTLAYLEGRQRSLGGDDRGAVTAFDVAGADGCPLASYAHLRAAQALTRLGDGELAERHAIAAKDLALVDDAKLTLADALTMKGDRKGAAALQRTYLAAHPSGARWVEIASKLAAALADGAEGEARAHAKEAHALATRVIVEAPAYETSTGALGTRAKALSLDPSLSGELTPGDRARRAQAWLDAGRGDKAFAESSALYKQIAKGKDRELACKVATTRAQASAKTKASTAEAWAQAVDACEGTADGLAAALYNAAKAHAGKKPKEAIALFARLEREFPTHRLADDARLRGAALVKDEGDAGAAQAMLEKLADDYPSGDMRGEALVRVALAHVARGSWSEAVPWLDRAVALDAGDRHWATAGRAAYYRARAAGALGDREAAKRGYAQVIATRPLSFYMLLSHARLRELDPAAAKEALAQAEAREADGAIVTRAHPELASPGFERARQLLAVGEVEAARKELVACGALTDAADSELVWIAATLFDRAGAPEVGSGLTRGRVQDHLDHWPKGRWRAMWEAAYPRAFEPLVTQAAAEQRTPRPLVWGIMREESAFHPDAVSPSAAYGLMQLIVPTAKQTAHGTSFPFDETSLKRPAVSIPLGAKLLASLRASYPHNPALAIPAYNGGAGAVGRWLSARGGEDFDVWVDEIPWEETRGYVKRVLSSTAAYAYLYDTPVLDEVLALPRVADGRAPAAGP